jgi:hypothetical protein
MAREHAQEKSKLTSPTTLLNRLEPIELEPNKQLSEHLQNIELETQLLALSGISLEQEIEAFREMLPKLRKQPHNSDSNDVQH